MQANLEVLGYIFMLLLQVLNNLDENNLLASNMLWMHMLVYSYHSYLLCPSLSKKKNLMTQRYAEEVFEAKDWTVRRLRDKKINFCCCQVSLEIRYTETTGWSRFAAFAAGIWVLDSREWQSWSLLSWWDWVLDWSRVQEHTYLRRSMATTLFTKIPLGSRKSTCQQSRCKGYASCPYSISSIIHNNLQHSVDGNPRNASLACDFTYIGWASYVLDVRWLL